MSTGTFPYNTMAVCKIYPHNITPVYKIYLTHKIYPTIKTLVTAKLGYELDISRTKKPQLMNGFRQIDQWACLWGILSIANDAGEPE